MHGEPRKEISLSDDKAKKGQQDRSRIDMNEDYEVRYWIKELGVSPEQLKSAVQKVGPTAKAY